MRRVKNDAFRVQDENLCVFGGGVRAKAGKRSTGEISLQRAEAFA